MKVYRKVEEIIFLASEFHGKLEAFYRRLTDKAEKERVGMLLQYLSRHENRLHEGLKRFSAEGQEKLRETRVQYVTGDEQLELPATDLSAEMSVNDVLSVALEVDDRLMTFYETVAQSAEMPAEVREMFRRLTEQQEQEKAKLSHIAEQVRNV